MNRVKGGGWEFLEIPGRKGFTWNPASGCSGQGCAVRARGVCWAEKIVKRLGHICSRCPSFEPHMHWNRLMEPFKRHSPAVIAPVSTGDLFGLTPYMIGSVLSVVRGASWHIFAVLTKLPQNAHIFNPYTENVWFGVSVNQQGDVWRLKELEKIDAGKRWAIFEPLYSGIDYDLGFLDWIIVGAQTQPEVQPEKSWVKDLIAEARRHGVPLFLKSNLKWPVKIKEFPST